MKSVKNTAYVFRVKEYAQIAVKNEASRVVSARCILVVLFDPESRDSMFCPNVGKLLPDYTASYP
jgi:hypothetical protein